MERITTVLSECCVWRMDILKTLITVGSMQGRSFIRLFNIIDELCAEGFLNGKDTIAQTGYDNYKSKYYDSFDLIGDDKFKEIIQKSDLIITHAGTGTVTASLKAGKKTIVFPRLSKYDEHYDDHQTELADLFESQGYVLQARNKDELVACINNIDNFVPKVFVTNNDRINKIIIDFIDKKLEINL